MHAKLKGVFDVQALQHSIHVSWRNHFIRTLNTILERERQTGEWYIFKKETEEELKLKTLMEEIIDNAAKSKDETCKLM